MSKIYIRELDLSINPDDIVFKDETKINDHKSLVLIKLKDGSEFNYEVNRKENFDRLINLLDIDDEKKNN